MKNEHSDTNADLHYNTYKRVHIRIQVSAPGSNRPTTYLTYVGYILYPERNKAITRKNFTIIKYYLFLKLVFSMTILEKWLLGKHDKSRLHSPDQISARLAMPAFINLFFCFEICITKYYLCTMSAYIFKKKMAERNYIKSLLNPPKLFYKCWKYLGRYS